MKAPSFLIPSFLLVFIALLRFAHFAFLSKGKLNVNPHSPFSLPNSTLPLRPAGRCDVFTGHWVFDEASHPLYQEEECPYIQPQLTCQEHGRPDNGYQRWRWQPAGCSLPAFNASLALEKLRGKRLLFVGDSLNRGQFTSMVCLLHRAIPSAAKSLETVDSLTVFHAKEYNATVEFYWAPFLVESNSDDAVVHRVSDRIVRARSVRRHARRWRGADVIVFNSYVWWTSGAQMKIAEGPFSGGVENVTLVPNEEAYGMAVRSVVRWVRNHMDPLKDRVFFSTMSPSHDRASEWGGGQDENCYNETKPTEDLAHWGMRGWSRNMMRVLREELVEQSRFPLTILNITLLSVSRKDAHTQIYKRQWSPPTVEQLANPKSYADCIHWCLPGLPDTWNELLYTKLFFPGH